MRHVCVCSCRYIHCFQKSDFREVTAFLYAQILKNWDTPEHTLGICYVRNTLAGFEII